MALSAYVVPKKISKLPVCKKNITNPSVATTAYKTYINEWPYF